jgi:hypothetical protein
MLSTGCLWEPNRHWQLSLGGATLELQVKLPAAAPLKAAEVECRNKVSRATGCVTGVHMSERYTHCVCWHTGVEHQHNSSVGKMLSVGCSSDARLSQILGWSYVGASGEAACCSAAALLKAAEVECRNKVRAGSRFAGSFEHM